AVVLYFFIFDKNKGVVIIPNKNLIEEKRTEYVEEYIDFVRNKDGFPILLETVEETESKIFIKKLSEAKLNPENILKVGNEIYFVSKVDKDGEGEGQALFIYDVLMRKFGELYFHKNEERGKDTSFVLVAIDAEGNKLVIVLKKWESDCDSLWLSQGANFYTFDLLDNGKEGLIKYKIPEWKIEEEKNKFTDCIRQFERDFQSVFIEGNYYMNKENR
ncbi:MAG: hypothetical protein ABIJ23_03365, partial [Candidatus Magasanikbacteria bacterium]